MNIRLTLACTAIGALSAGAALAQDQTTEQQYHKPYANPAYAGRHPHRVDRADRCDRTYATRTGYACNNQSYARARNRRAYRGEPYAYGYDNGYYPDQADYPAYDGSGYYGPYGQDAPAPTYYPPVDQGYYPPPAEAYGAPAAYEGPDVAPVVVPGRRFYWEHPGDTSPAAQYSVRLHSYVNPHSSVTAIPTPNNVSDQVPSHGYDYDGVPQYYPY